MNIVVCVKQVPDTAVERTLTAEGTLDRASLDNLINELDEYAIEEGLKIAEAQGGEVTILSMGPAKASESIRKALSMGAAKAVHVVDDGLATGVTARAALRAVRARGAARTVLAVPVAAPAAVLDLQKETDEVVTLVTPRRFHSVGEWYANFGQLTDADVLTLLAAIP